MYAEWDGLLTFSWNVQLFNLLHFYKIEKLKKDLEKTYFHNYIFFDILE